MKMGTVHALSELRPPSSPQAAAAVIMVRPNWFHPNPETSEDNVFQTESDGDETSVSGLAAAEFDAAVEALEGRGVGVHVFHQPDGIDVPDCVFPNNWISTHAGGHIAIFPMYAKSRQLERRFDIVEMLKASYRVQDVIDYSGLERDGLSLEGTGAMVLDHIARIAYTVRSNRADPIILERFCTNFNYEPMVFNAADPDGNAIYHTNVIMTLGTRFALVCLEIISDRDRRDAITERLRETGREVIELTYEQVCNFAGNALELSCGTGLFLAMSARGVENLTSEQRQSIETYVPILPISIPTIEKAGGSVRCMLAEVHLAKR